MQRTNLNGAVLLNADLTDADLSGANISETALTGAVYCNTVMPDGKVNNSGCVVEKKVDAVVDAVVEDKTAIPVKK